MSEYFEFRWTYMLPFFLGFYRWGMFIILKAIPSFFYREKKLDYEYKGPNPEEVSKNDITMIIPLYMPEPGFDECLLSWIKAKPKKIIIVADKVKGYDQVSELVNNLECGDVIVQVISETEPGKRAAMYRGLEYVDTKITVFADDDALYNPLLLDSLIQPFKDPNMGGVGTRQIARPKNIDGSWDMWDIVMDIRLFQRYVEIRATSFMGGGASCLSGRTMAYRTKLFKPNDKYYKSTFKNLFLNERFAGQLQLSGDDKCLTRICINSNYKMYTQIAYECTLSTQFEKGKKLLKQILRWSRNTWRSDLKLLFVEKKVWFKYPWLTLVLLDKIISPFTMVSGPFIILYITIREQNLFVTVGFLIYLLITRFIKTVLYFFYGNPRPPLWWVVYMPHFILFQYLSSVFRIWALFTLNNSKWGNRLVKINKKTGKVVRTDENHKTIDSKSENINIQKNNYNIPDIISFYISQDDNANIANIISSCIIDNNDDNHDNHDNNNIIINID